MEEDNIRTKKVTLVLNDKEHLQLIQRSKDLGLSMSSYVRQKLLYENDR